MKARSNVYLLGFIFTLFIVLIDSSGHSNYRTKPRSTRGFKNAALSTARGFGKRDPGFSRDPYSAIPEWPIEMKESVKEDFLKVHHSPSERFAIDWFVEELSKNPRLARIIGKEFIEKNQSDEFSSSEELLQDVDY